METKTIGIRLKDEDKKNLERQAARNGLTVAQYIRMLAKLNVSLKTVIKEMRAVGK